MITQKDASRKGAKARRSKDRRREKGEKKQFWVFGDGWGEEQKLRRLEDKGSIPEFLPFVEENQQQKCSFCGGLRYYVI